MCPLCIGSVLLAATGASFSGGLALLATRLLGPGSPKLPAPALTSDKPADRSTGSADRAIGTPDR